ncbi:MAG: CBS domain-containing protein, partial [Promethearchaeota archaeon]
MTPRVYTLPSSAHFRDLIHLMYEKGVSAIFILDEDSGKFYLISHT